MDKRLIIDISHGSAEHALMLTAHDLHDILINGSAQNATTITLSLTLQEHAQCSIRARCAAAGDAQVALNLTIIHAGNQSVSHVDCRAVAHDAARISYIGRVIIPKTRGVDAAQYARILLVGEQSQGRADPIIEVEAQDVACKHGSAVAPIPHEEIRFLRARGISEPVARELYIQAFLKE